MRDQINTLKHLNIKHLKNGGHDLKTTVTEINHFKNMQMFMKLLHNKMMQFETQLNFLI